MPKYRITAPDGGTYEITAPEGASDADIMWYAQQNLTAGSQPQTQRVELPQQPNEVPYGEGLARAGFQGLTFGAGDEITAGGVAALRALGGNNFGETYDKVLSHERGNMERFREQAPVASTVAEIGGALPTAMVPLGALGRAAQGGSLATRALAGGAIGAGQGGLYGFNAGEGGFDERLDDAAIGATIGGGIGGVAAPAIGAGVRSASNALARTNAGKATIAAAPSLDDLASRASALFKQADDMGVVVKPEAYRSFADDVAALAAKEGIDAQVTPSSAGALSRILSEADSGQPLSLQTLNTVRRVAQNAAGSNDPNERRIASLMIDKLDDFIDDLTPDKMVGTATGEPGPILREARNLWSRMRRGEMLQEAEYRAGNQASGVENGIRTQFRSILNSPTKRRGMTQEEIAALERVVQGTPLSNTLKRVGRMSFGTGQQSGFLGGSVGSAAGAGAGSVVGGPVGAAVGAAIPPAIGYAAQRGAQGIAARNNRLAQALIANGGLEPVRLNQNAGRLAQLLAQRNAAIAGPLSPR